MSTLMRCHLSRVESVAKSLTLVVLETQVQCQPSFSEAAHQAVWLWPSRQLVAQKGRLATTLKAAIAAKLAAWKTTASASSQAYFAQICARAMTATTANRALQTTTKGLQDLQVACHRILNTRKKMSEEVKTDKWLRGLKLPLWEMVYSRSV